MLIAKQRDLQAQITGCKGENQYYCVEIIYPA